jgi:hypothetical protein
MHFAAGCCYDPRAMNASNRKHTNVEQRKLIIATIDFLIDLAVHFRSNIIPGRRTTLHAESLLGGVIHSEQWYRRLFLLRSNGNCFLKELVLSVASCLIEQDAPLFSNVGAIQT